MTVKFQDDKDKRKRRTCVVDGISYVVVFVPNKKDKGLTTGIAARLTYNGKSELINPSRLIEIRPTKVSP